MIKLKDILLEKVNKSDISYQLAIDYTGRTKPKVVKLNRKKIEIFYGYKINPQDVIDSIKKLYPSIKIKHDKWNNRVSGGGTHEFIFEGEGCDCGCSESSCMGENFKDGKVKGKSRPGRVKRSGASCKGSVTDLRAKAKKYGGEKGKMYHWCANMKSGRK